MNQQVERHAQDALSAGQKAAILGSLATGAMDAPQRSPFTPGPRPYPHFPLSRPLALEWDNLAARAMAAPYLHLGWAEAWCRAFSEGDTELRTLRRDGRLAAVLPMVRKQKVLESAANYHTPGFGLLAEDREAASALAQDLFQEEPLHISLTSLDPEGDTIKACRRAAEEAGYRVVVRPFQRSLYLDLDEDWDAYEAGLGKNLLRNLKRARRQLELEGEVTVDVVCGGTQLDEHLRQAFLVEAASWKGAAGTAIQSDPRTQRFYTAVGRWAAERGMLRLFFLRMGRRPLAMYLALQDHGVCYLHKGGYDPAFGRYSPGKMLLHEVIRDCFMGGVKRIEFNGDAEPYKFCWTGAVREYQRFDAFAPSMAGQLAWATYAYSRPVTHHLRRGLGLMPKE